MSEFNINETVSVRLTPHGLDILKAKHEAMMARWPSIQPWTPPKTDGDGYSSHQLWTLMQDFGDSIFAGGPVPFETTIRIPDDKLKP